MQIPKYSDIRKEYPWLPESRHIDAIRGLYKTSDGNGVITIAFKLEDFADKDIEGNVLYG